jgi:NTP pyrophosphatase (non-canonical NTP hydrolase)
MDATTTIQALKDRCAAFCRARDWERFHTPKEMAIGLATEAGELLAEFRFKSDAEAAALLKDPAKRQALGHEVCDVLYFLLRFCAVAGIDVTEAFESKMRINERRYPVAQARGRNAKYTELKRERRVRRRRAARIP